MPSFAAGSVKESTVLRLLHEEYLRKVHSTPGAPQHQHTGVGSAAPADEKERADMELMDREIHREMETFKLGDRNLEECFQVRRRRCGFSGVAFFVITYAVLVLTGAFLFLSCCRFFVYCTDCWITMKPLLL